MPGRRGPHPRTWALTLAAFVALAAAGGGASAAPPAATDRYAHAPSPAGPADAWRPAGWPPDAPVPATVRDAAGALRSARAALHRERLGLEAEVRLAPELGALWRDDPPRPVRTELAFDPEAAVRWSPLRSEALLAEARVLEAEVAWRDAWRDAILARWRVPVEAARLRTDVADARSAVAAARDAFAAAEAAVTGSDGDGAAPNPEAADALDEAALDLREARLDLDDATRDLAAATEAWAAFVGAGGPAIPPEARRAVPVPPPPRVEATAAVRALALRRAADVARAERRAFGAAVPEFEVEAGYAGSDAEVSASAGVRTGRPFAELRGELGGTPQERGWLRAGLVLRLGTDAPAAAEAADLARRRLEVDAAAAADAWRAELVAADAEVASRRARWELAEARLELARRAGNADGASREEDAARRAFLAYLGAIEDAFELRDAVPPAP